MFVRPGVAGPFRASAEVESTRSERIPVRLTLRDEGRDGRVVSVASAVLRRV
jgi:acyl-coenzyme A thioesterase PaaI-like protein